ncbi:MAG TPA: class I SAM-dependent methyltransferase [Methylomirabilota bacterium]|nr:class I SAM-dependent methyltransferase [Methylomirabilota bacterium]
MIEIPKSYERINLVRRVALPNELDFKGLHPVEYKNVRENNQLVQNLLRSGQLTLANVSGSVLEIGPGYGACTPVLKVFSSDVQVVEKSKSGIVIAEKKILPAERVHLGQDGITFMNSRPEEFNFIASFMFGPLSHGHQEDLMKEIYTAAMTALRPDGEFFMTSDPHSFEVIEKTCKYPDVEIVKLKEFDPVFIGRKPDKI